MWPFNSRPASCCWEGRSCSLSNCTGCAQHAVYSGACTEGYGDGEVTAQITGLQLLGRPFARSRRAENRRPSCVPGADAEYQTC
ncbi:hypothetical protein KIF59_13780 [Enterobacter cloacae subsp. cloacae]|nr:hypothetical protein [Enterobacter cloacae subsp. cloacae]